MNRRDSLLFYCQHSLGMGHLVRSLALAESFAVRFRVVFLNGGPLPKGMRIPEGVEIVDLPPLGIDTTGKLVSRDRRRTVERACSLRRRIILETYRRTRPRVIFVELFPFGRKKFAGELMPVLEEAKCVGGTRPLVCCSLRDILVGKRADQRKHDERAVNLANEYFDAVMVHSDPTFARLEESMHQHATLRTPVYYTGFVQADRKPNGGAKPEGIRQIIVSAGGGLVGETLFRTAVEAYSLLGQPDDVRMKIITGPFLPDGAWQTLRAATQGRRGLSLKRFVPDLCAEMRGAAASISQCGYNTALDILRACIPALVVPFAEGQEDEQSKRARRLAERGAIRVLEQKELSAARLAEEMRGLLDFKPRRLHLDVDGARNAARILDSLVGARRRESRAVADGKTRVPEVHT
jgi:predicted glycosyltransferase